MKKFAVVDLRLAQIRFGMAILWNFVSKNIAETENLHRNHYKFVLHTQTHIQMLIVSHYVNPLPSIMRYI